MRSSGNNLVLTLSGLIIHRGLATVDDLVLAIGDVDYRNDTNPGRVYIYQFDKNRSDWVAMGQEIKGTMDPNFGYSMQLAGNSTGVVLLGVFGSLHFRTYRYEHNADSWIQFGSNLLGDDEISNDYNGVGEVALSNDSSTLATGVRNEAGGFGIKHFRVFSYDATADDWVQLGDDVQDESVIFGESSLSAHGRVLATTAEGLDMVSQAFVTGQVRIWDFVAGSSGANSGEWVQRGETVKVDDQDDLFGWRVALSANGDRFATTVVLYIHRR
jgi:hypothetical protein